MVESDDDGVIETRVDSRGFEVVELTQQFRTQTSLKSEVGECYLAEAVFFLEALAQVMHDESK